MGKRFNKRALENISSYGQVDEKKQLDRKKKQEESYLTEANRPEL